MQRHGLRHVDRVFFSYPVKTTTASRGEWQGDGKRAEVTSHFSVGAEIRCREAGSYGRGRPQFRKSHARLLSTSEKRKKKTYDILGYSFILCRVDARFRNSNAKAHIKLVSVQFRNFIFVIIYFIFIYSSFMNLILE